MSGLGERFPEFQAAGHQVAPNEIDRYEYVHTGILSTSATWVGTAAGGTAGVNSALVLINTLTDYPRNLLYSSVGTNDHGGTWTVNGFNQFGDPITEVVGNGTVAAGTPAWQRAGTAIFSKVTSGTYVGAGVGLGSARLGVAVGTAGTLAFKLGLLTKIASTADVKHITWIKENVVTTLGGGSIGSYVDATNHAFTGTAIMGGTEEYKVILKPSWSNLQKTNLAKL